VLRGVRLDHGGRGIHPGLHRCQRHRRAVGGAVPGAVAGHRQDRRDGPAPLLRVPRRQDRLLPRHRGHRPDPSHAPNLTVELRGARFMIMGSFDRIATETTHDHGLAGGGGPGGGGWGRRGSTCRFRGLASCRISVLSGRLLTGGMMRAVWLVLVAGFRRQWRSCVLLGLLIAVASGFVLASTAAGRRTDSAFPRYLASHGYDAIVFTVQPLPKLGPQDGVAQVTPVQMPFGG